MTNLLIAAIMMVESGGNHLAVGDGGTAIGPLQIRQAAVTDVNRIYGTKFTLNQTTNLAVSTKIFTLYTGHWCTERRLGRTPTNQDIARVWNGGPNGWRRRSTQGYWEKVRKALR
jgi:hypothetical protein